MRRRTKIIIIVVLALVGLSIWSIFWSDYRVGVDSVNWLPAEAHNITYTRNLWETLAEFDIEQKAFQKWCDGQGMPLRELGDAGFQRVYSVRRCVGYLEQRGIMQTAAEPNETERDFLRTEKNIKVFRPGDLVYEKRWSNGGGHTIGYDTKEKRGYYEYSHH
jgi:hypothetical protein